MIRIIYNIIVTSSDSYDELNPKIEWYWVNVLGLAPNTSISTWSRPNRMVCGCSGQTTTPSYDPCHCEPIYGPGGYPPIINAGVMIAKVI